MYKYYNANPLKKNIDDCSIRAISVALGLSWDNVYDLLSDLAQQNGTLQGDRDLVLDFLDSNFDRVSTRGMTVGKVAEVYDNFVCLITMRGHITCSKYGKIYDTFDPSERLAEFCWIVE